MVIVYNVIPGRPVFFSTTPQRVFHPQLSTTTMPPFRRKSKQELIEQEGRIQCAIQDIKNKKYVKIAPAARHYNIHPNTLAGRLRGLQPQAELRNHQHRLSLAQENVLIAWIVSLDIRGAPPRPSRVREMAEIILKEYDPACAPIGRNWVTGFTKRCPDIKTRMARKISRQRAVCEDPKVIGPFFQELEKIKDKHGILDEDIFNFDETGFAMGLIASTRVVSRAEMPGKPWPIMPGNREWVTTIECINSAGWSVPTTIIFKGKRYIEGWFEGFTAPPAWRVEVSANGWTTDEIGLR